MLHDSLVFSFQFKCKYKYFILTEIINRAMIFMVVEKDELEAVKHLTEPFYFEGTLKIGLLLVHGFTASPTEMLPVGKYLNSKGYTVLGVRLAGHGINYKEMTKYSWKDWYASVEDGYNFLKSKCDNIVPIGISMGATLCLYLVHNVKEANICKLILLAPIFAPKSKLAYFSPILKYVKKYVYKGDGTLQLYKDNNLYSYYYYPTKSIQDLITFLKVIKSTNMQITIPTLVIYGLLDETVSIHAIEEAICNKFTSETQIRVLRLKNSGHLLTIGKDFEYMLNEMEKSLES
ncbi:MAG: alpha/beta fold hydrolase [Candidatus Heimdallarchaeota archaeon]|nr:alpha/beta fold hydrolase [Candidatus Heimdallarchaeota archaeon]